MSTHIRNGASATDGLETMDTMTSMEYLKNSSTKKSAFGYIVSSKNVAECAERLLAPLPASLFSYHNLNEFVLADLHNNRITATNPKLFNDLYDSSSHINSFASEKENLKELSDKLVQFGIEMDESCGVNLDYLERQCVENDYHYMPYMSEPMRVKCFAESGSNVLMWSHYANNNQGICIEYDFSSFADGKLFYPVIYCQKPLDLTDLLRNHNGSNEKIRLGILLSVIAKYNVWSYESEWRFIHSFYDLLSDIYKVGGDNSIAEKLPDRIHIQNVPNPKSIILGKVFFEYWSKRRAEAKGDLPKEYSDFIILVKDKKIPIKIMRNARLSYELEFSEIKNIEGIEAPHFFKESAHWGAHEHNKARQLKNAIEVTQEGQYG